MITSEPNENSGCVCRFCLWHKTFILYNTGKEQTAGKEYKNRARRKLLLL